MFIRSWLGASPVFLLGTLSACQHAAVAPAAASAKGLPPAPAVQLAVVAAPPLASSPEAADLSPFVEGVRLGYEARLSVVGKEALLSTDKLLLRVHDDQVLIEPALLEGLHPGSSRFPRVFGSLPDSAFAVEVSYSERTSRSTLARWSGSEWVSVDALLQRRSVIGVSPWSAGRTLALVADEYANQLGFVQLGGPRGATLPALDPSARSSYACVHGIQPSALSALPSGEVFLAGSLCTVGRDDSIENRGVAIERWEAGKSRGKLGVLPGLSAAEAESGEVTSLLAVSATDVFAAGVQVQKPLQKTEAKDEAYLAHFDGHTWQALAAPPTERVEELQRSPDGKLWALASGELWVTTSGALDKPSWERVPLPRIAKEAGEHAIRSFWVRGTGDVWATAGSDGFSYLLRTKRGAEPLTVPTDGAVAELSRALDPGAGYECEAPTLLLMTLSRQAPTDADFPGVRAALRGHTELLGKAQFIELSFLTRRYLGVRGDAETLQRASAVLEESNLPGVSPELRCINAPATRTLALDLSGPKAPLTDNPPVTGVRISHQHRR